MYFYNTNSKKGLWTAWHYSFVEPVHKKINSLYDYLMYFNPAYDILNSNVQYEQSEISQINQKFFKEIIITIHNEKQEEEEVKFLCCKINLLQYHQGIINLESDDALCVFEDSDHILYTLNSNYKIKENGSNNYIITTLDDILLSDDKILSIKRDFLQSTICFSMIQPLGINNQYNVERKDINNYYFIPLGNAGSYDMFINNNHLICHWNQMDNVINIMFNLSSDYMRLCTETKWTPNSNYWTSENYNYDKKYNFYIHDVQENLWTGSPKILHEERLETDSHQIDSFFFDESYSINQEVQNNNLINRFSIFSTKDIKCSNVKVFLY